MAAIQDSMEKQPGSLKRSGPGKVSANQGEPRRAWEIIINPVVSTQRLEFSQQPIPNVSSRNPGGFFLLHVGVPWVIFLLLHAFLMVMILDDQAHEEQN